MGFLVTAVTNSNRTWPRRSVLTVLVAGSVACAGLVLHGGINTLKEAVDFRAARTEQANTAAASWLRSHYDGGKVLMESFGNETVTFGSHIPLGQIVYEGSFKQWEPDRVNPAGHGIRWIYMRQTPGSQDQIFSQLHGTAQLASYRLVYQDPARLIYEKLRAGQQVDHPRATGRSGSHRAHHRSRQPIRRASSVVLQPVSANSFDAFGNDGGNEAGAAAKYAIDNNPTSFWHTDYYYNYPTFGNLKTGSGLILDMGEQVRLSQVVVQFGTRCCAHVQIEIGNDNNPLPSALGTFTPVQSSTTAAGSTVFNVANTTTGRYVLIWITYLPSLAGSANQFEAQVYNVAVHGSAVSRRG